MNPHVLTVPNTDTKEYTQARYHYLLQIIFGETIAIDYCNQMATFAPNKEAHDYLLQQQKEENLHLEQLTEYVGTHPRGEELISPYLRKLDTLMSTAIADKDYVRCVFIQNFIVEGLNITFLRELEHHADGFLSELCGTILRDEVGHMEFGISETRRILKEDSTKKLRNELIWLQRKALFYSTGLAMTLAREAKFLGIPMDEFAKKALDEHYDRIARSEFPLPYIDRFLFRAAIIFLSLF